MKSIPLCLMVYLCALAPSSIVPQSEMARLRIQVAEMHQEYELLNQVIEQHKQAQQELSSPLERLEREAKDLSKLSRHLEQQSVKAEMHELAMNISLLLAKKQELKKLLRETSQLLQDLLWSEISEKLAKADQAQKSGDTQSVARLVWEIPNLLQEITSLEEFTKDSFRPLPRILPSWDFQGNETMAEREEKKRIFEHILEIGQRTRQELTNRERKLEGQRALLLHLLELVEPAQQSVFDGFLESWKIECQNVQKQLPDISICLQRASANLSRIDQQETQAYLQKG